MNLLITGAFDWKTEELKFLKELGHSVVFMQQEKDPLPCDASWVEGIIGNGIFLSHPIENFTSLRFVQLTSAGFDRVPYDYIKEHDIKIYNARGVYSIPMAEFAFCCVLDLYKKSRKFYDNQKEHKWEKERNLSELFEKNVCIVGCGSVGNECAKRFSAFGCLVTGVDVAPYENDLYEKILPIDELATVLNDADITVLTLPLTEDTKNLIDKEKLDAMKSGSVLVNIARGAIVDNDALVEALKDHLGGAVLDVFCDEPLDKISPLWDMENVIITPHNSFVGNGNHKRMWDVILKNLCS